MDVAMEDDAAEQRVCERASLSRPVAVAAAGGDAIAGVLVNASLGGVLVALASDAGSFAAGQEAELRLSPDEGARAYPCQVVRAGDDGMLALAIDRKAAARFGLEITRGLFVRRPAA